MWMRAAVGAFLVAAVAASARAQGYDVAPATGRMEARPATAVRLDVDARRPETSARSVTLPFEFRYFGEPYAVAVVSAHGWIVPGAGRAFENGADPAAAHGQDATSGAFPYGPGGASADGIIAPLWARSAGDGGAQAGAAEVHAWTSGEAPARRFVVSWEGLDVGGGRAATVQLQLHEIDGTIVFAYATTTRTGTGPAAGAVCGLDECGGNRFVAPMSAGADNVGQPPSDFVFTPRTVLVNPPDIRPRGVPMTWQRGRKEALIPTGGTNRCSYLARGQWYFSVPDRGLLFWDAAGATRKRPADTERRLLEDDRATFGGERGGRERWLRQVLDGKVLLLPCDGGEPVRVWFRLIEFFTLDEYGVVGADFHVWSLRWMLASAFPEGDPRGRIDSYVAWKAMARSRLTVGKLFDQKQTDDAGRQFDSGRTNEYVLWAGRLKHGTRGRLAPYATPESGWTRFWLKLEDMNHVQHADRNDLRFVADPNYVDGHYAYVIGADDNPHGWMAGAGVPPLPLRDEGFDEDPGRDDGAVTPR